jgi:subtilase family serine protease
VEKALHLTLRVYNHPTENRTFYAPDVEPSLDLTVPVIHIGGLDSYIRPYPRSHKMKPVDPKVKPTFKAGSAPGGAYMGKDFTAAYVPGTTLTGAGQKVGLFQADGYFPSDIQAYEALNGLPNVPLTNVLIDGATGGVTDINANGEVSLDIEMVISMAPGVSEVIVYEGSLLNFIPEDILNRMATDNAAKSLSSSWGWTGGPNPVIDQIFQEMILQGQTFFDASGDSDAFPPGAVDDPTVPNAPSDNPYIVQVGGTTLTTSGPGGAWVSETVWNWGGGEGSSGGTSSYYAIPTWQHPEGCVGGGQCLCDLWQWLKRTLRRD